MKVEETVPLNSMREEPSELYIQTPLRLASPLMRSVPLASDMSA